MFLKSYVLVVSGMIVMATAGIVVVGAIFVGVVNI